MKKFRNWTLVRIEKMLWMTFSKISNTQKLPLPQNTQIQNIKNKSHVRRPQIKNQKID